MDLEAGIGIGLGQVRVGLRPMATWSWGLLIRRARRPDGARRRIAVGRIWLKCSTARRVTVAARAPGRSSARLGATWISLNPRARIASRRNVTFLLFDSMRVTDVPGDQILIGRPGNPAPDPMSARSGWVCGA